MESKSLITAGNHHTKGAEFYEKLSLKKWSIYRQVGDYFIPNITFRRMIGRISDSKYGRMRRSYLKEYRKIPRQQLCVGGNTVQAFSWKSIKSATSALKNIVSAMAKQEGVCPAMQSHFQTPVVFWWNPPIV